MSGRKAIVTGASGGIGEATARELAARGSDVMLASRNVEKLRFLEREIRAFGGRAIAVETDMTDERSVAGMIETGAREFGTVDILVNNAGVGLSGRVADLRGEDLCYLFEVNVLGPLRCIQAALPHMNKGGRIINISSVIGKRAIPKVGGYCATKFALNALSDALRVEVADQGISVTTVYPGTTRTSFSENSRRTGKEGRGWRIRGVEPERVAKKIADVAESGGRDVYVTLLDRVFVVTTSLFPGLTDRALSVWVKG